MRYRYEGFDKGGVVRHGFVEAADDGEASETIREQHGIYANLIELDNNQPMKKLFDHAPVVAAAPVDAVRPAQDTQGPVTAGLPDWRGWLKTELEGLASVLREVEDLHREWDKASKGKGVAKDVADIGGVTWKIMRENQDRAATVALAKIYGTAANQAANRIRGG